ncbi:MAG TPA: ABC transporter substrate-binding protein [Methylomirabilota bacterium]|nr:ABC transporter substrate-binding protein [Methylomirabilota bacterium]
MDRRAFLGSLAGGALAVPRATAAQPARKVARIGILGLAATSTLVGAQPRSASANAFIAGLRELGYVYGEHFVTEARGVDARPERFPGLVAELLRLGVDVVVAPGPALPALKSASSTVPVVMAASVDPVAQGFAQSLGRPGGTFTGLSFQSVEMAGKRLELLKELVPGAAPVAVIWNRSSVLNWQAAEAVGREQRWKVIPLEIQDADGIEEAFRKASSARAGAILVFAAGVLYPHARRVAELAARSRLPAMYELRQYVEAGGLMCYGADINDIWRRAAVFVDKILKGARPAELPIEQPSEFELVINLKTAKALGLAVPQSLLLRADEVIQ